MATATTRDIEDFGTPTATWAVPTHWALNTAADNTNNDHLCSGTLTAEVDAPTDGATVEVPAGDLSLEITEATGFDNAGAVKALQGLVVDDTYLSLHTADPAANNELGTSGNAGAGYARPTVAGGHGASDGWMIT